MFYFALQALPAKKSPRLQWHMGLDPEVPALFAPQVPSPRVVRFYLNVCACPSFTIDSVDSVRITCLFFEDDPTAALSFEDEVGPSPSRRLVSLERAMASIRDEMGTLRHRMSLLHLCCSNCCLT